MNRPNEQKLFYGLLVKHREEQLENYAGSDLTYAASDYHHVRPLAQTRMVSTRNFSQPKSKGHKRQASRFTVISNVSRDREATERSYYAATDAAETVQSYDPFRASQPQNIGLIDDAQAAYANVTVHRRAPTPQYSSSVQNTPVKRFLSASAANSSEHSNRFVAPRAFASRSSLASSARSRGGNSSIIRAPIGHKRGVSFSHIRKPSMDTQRKASVKGQSAQIYERHSKFSEVTDDDGSVIHKVGSPAPGASTRYIRSKKTHISVSHPVMNTQKPAQTTRLWNDDVRQLSSSLAKDCDEAFNRTSAATTAQKHTTSRINGHSAGCDTPAMTYVHDDYINTSSPTLPRLSSRPVSSAKRNTSLDTRPLPPPPTRSDSVQTELTEARRQAQLRRNSGQTDQSPGHVDRMVSHIDRLIQPDSSPMYIEDNRRIASAPVEAVDSKKYLPSIYESNDEAQGATDFDKFMHNQRRKAATNQRIASAPEARGRHGHPIQGVRIVQTSSPSPAKPPAPLNIRKKSSVIEHPLMTGGLGTRYEDTAPASSPPRMANQHQQATYVGDYAEEAPETADYDLPVDGTIGHNSLDGTVRKKKSSWFKRNSKAESGDHRLSGVEVTQEPPKKKSFGLSKLFKKRNSKQEPDMMITCKLWTGELLEHANHITARDEYDSSFNSPTSQNRRSQNRRSQAQESHTRQIEPQQNWLARLFHVKPATRLVCFTISKRRARQEVTNLLKEWRKYGIRDVTVDRQRNIVFGRVGAQNCKSDINLDGRIAN